MLKSVMPYKLVARPANRAATILLSISLGFTVFANGQRSSDIDGWDFKLGDTEGKVHSRREFAKAKAAVFFFLATECPISNRYAPEINRIVADYSKKGIVFYSVHSDPDQLGAAVRKHRADYGYGFPVLLDPGQTLAARFDVTLTPTMLITSPEGRLIYRGRIDNRYLDFGKYRDAGVISDGRLALDAVIAGRPVPEAVTRPIGCSLPRPHAQPTSLGRGDLD